MKRRLLLILPALQQLKNYEFRLIKYSRFPPLSLLTIAGLTPPEDWDVVVRDEHVESSEVEGQVDLVGIQTYISSSGRAYELAQRWRERGAKVVLGGLHPTSLPDEAAQHADAVCTGPAETVWGEILGDFERGRLKKRYAGRREGSAALVPTPRRDLMNRRAYLIRHTMVTSRGCPHSCDFCYKTSFWGPAYYEARPIAEIERELATIDDRLVFFLDDNLLANRRHARAMFDVLRGSGIVWQAAASLDVARDPGYLAEAYDAGCRSLFVGFESLSPENMRGNNKPVNAATDYAEACRRFHDAGIMVNGSFVFGFDCDKPDVFDRTVEFAIEAKILTATFHVLTPLPGTRAFARLEAEGRLLHRDWAYYDTDHAVFRPRGMTAEELEQGHKRAYREFLSYGSILRRSFGVPGTLKRLAYNVAWMRLDPLWVAIIRSGLMPYATRIFDRVLRLNTRPTRPVRPEAVAESEKKIEGEDLSYATFRTTPTTTPSTRAFFT
ncbi:MAG: B12-binding domain-containing radical SAM protein [Planctomycetes bacterium]|nr:B12-binding domain-containing radical SAM protein [Planctomycetota bacterium]